MCAAACGAKAAPETGSEFGAAATETTDGPAPQPSQGDLGGGPKERPNGEAGEGQGASTTDDRRPGDSGGDEGPRSMNHACVQEPPEGSPRPPAFPTYGGTCPTLTGAPAENVLVSSGASRRFLVVIPKDLQPEERLPVLFLWHWLGGSASSMLSHGELQKAADTQRFVGVIPIAKGDVPTRWPFDVTQSARRMNEEFQFFDDMLACVAAQFPGASPNCVATAGVSAGALFSAQLASARAARLSSLVSLSGGTGGVIRDFGNPARRVPALVLWGGPTDACAGSVLSFETASRNLERSLAQGGGFFVECIHNCGHAQPPVDGPEALSRFAGFWQFVFDHPYALPQGTSPYSSGNHPLLPAWCKAGGGATPRTGACTTPSGC
jgi:pimeloyl-ACP methyl ester carboxylesterase